MLPDQRRDIADVDVLLLRCRQIAVERPVDDGGADDQNQGRLDQQPKAFGGSRLRCGAVDGRGHDTSPSGGSASDRRRVMVSIRVSSVTTPAYLLPGPATTAEACWSARIASKASSSVDWVLRTSSGSKASASVSACLR